MKRMWAIALASGALAATPALADKGGKGGGHDQGSATADRHGNNDSHGNGENRGNDGRANGDQRGDDRSAENQGKDADRGSLREEQREHSQGREYGEDETAVAGKPGDQDNDDTENKGKTNRGKHLGQVKDKDDANHGRHLGELKNDSDHDIDHPSSPDSNGK